MTTDDLRMLLTLAQAAPLARAGDSVQVAMLFQRIEAEIAAGHEVDGEVSAKQFLKQLAAKRKAAEKKSDAG